MQMKNHLHPTQACAHGNRANEYIRSNVSLAQLPEVSFSFFVHIKQIEFHNANMEKFHTKFCSIFTFSFIPKEAS